MTTDLPRVRRPPDWSQSIGGSGVEITAFVLPVVALDVGEEINVEGLRHRVLDVTPTT